MQRTYVLLSILALLLIGLVWTLKPSQGPESQKTAHPSNTLELEEEEKESSELEEKETFEEEMKALIPRSSRAIPLANPSSLRNEEIAGVSYDGQRYIFRLTNGKQVALWPSQMDQLPPEVRERVLYRRGGGPRR